MNHHFVKRTWCRGQDPLEWADMRRRLSGKVENDGLLLRVLRSSGQLTLFIVESEGWWFCWWRWSPGCWSRSMMSTSFTQAALCLTTSKNKFKNLEKCKVAKTHFCVRVISDPNLHFFSASRWPVLGAIISHFAGGFQISVITTNLTMSFLTLWNCSWSMWFWPWPLGAYECYGTFYSSKHEQSQTLRSRAETRTPNPRPCSANQSVNIWGWWP